MLKASSLSISYDADPVLQNVSFVLATGERVGLVGANGSGKSTLLKLLAGQLEPDSGSVWVDPAGSVAYLPQYPLDELHLSVRDSLLRGAGRVGELQGRVVELEHAMPNAQGETLDALLHEYAEAREEFERLGGYELDARVDQVVHGLALQAGTLDMPVSALSGGNKTKLSLARLLLSGASILLLDEPTNYLDLPSLLWLERFVTEGGGLVSVSNRSQAGERDQTPEGGSSYVIVSHDRRFLDRTVSSILELDPTQHTLRVWPGNYSDYAEARLREQQKQLEAYRDQQEEIARIEEDIRRTREQARSTESHTQVDTTRRYAKKVARKAKAREHRLERQIEENTIEKPGRSWGLHLADLGREPIEDDRTVLDVKDLRAGYGEQEVLCGASLTVRGRDRVVLLGPNGSGKSTLLRCVTGAVPFQGTVRAGSNVRTGFLSQEGDELPLDSTVFDAFRSRTRMYEDEARTYLHKFLFTGEEVFKSVRALSYGQRAKLALGILVLSDANFLVLDEPTSHMDVPALEAIEDALAEYKGPSLLVSHDRYFIERIGVNRVEVLEGGRLRAVESVQEYEEELSDDD